MMQSRMLKKTENLTTSVLSRGALVLLLVLFLVPHVETELFSFSFWPFKQSDPSDTRENEADDKDVKVSCEWKNSDIEKINLTVSKLLEQNATSMNYTLRNTATMEEIKKNSTLLGENLININESMGSLNSSMQAKFDKNEQQLANLTERMDKLSNDSFHLFQTLSDISKRLEEHGETGIRLERRSKDNIDQIKKIEVTTYWVDILLVFIILILLIYITNITQKNRGFGFKHDKNSQLERRPAVVCFNPASSEVDRKLAEVFLDDYSFIIIHDYQDIPRIHSKVVFLFVDFNERNIILETYRETQQIKAETVTAIKKLGGTPVVIYRLHSDSKNLGNGQLYSDKLTSIENHPILRELVEKECVLSIDKEFTEYQQKHLKKLYKNNL